MVMNNDTAPVMMGPPPSSVREKPWHLQRSPLPATANYVSEPLLQWRHDTWQQLQPVGQLHEKMTDQHPQTIVCVSLHAADYPARGHLQQSEGARSARLRQGRPLSCSRLQSSSGIFPTGISWQIHLEIPLLKKSFPWCRLKTMRSIVKK